MQTEDPKWLEPLYGLLNTTLAVFFPKDDIMVEVGCENYPGGCNTDGLTFKSFTLRWLAITTQLVPQTADIIWPYIQASANGAAGQCDGGDDGSWCGYHWTTTVYDGSGLGVGQQMSALAAIQANMIQVDDLPLPLTLKTGGTSKSDGSAGTSDGSSTINPIYTRPITTADKAGAGIVTALVLAFLISGTYWLVFVEVD